MEISENIKSKIKHHTSSDNKILKILEESQEDDTLDKVTIFFKIYEKKVKSNKIMCGKKKAKDLPDYSKFEKLGEKLEKEFKDVSFDNFPIFGFAFVKGKASDIVKILELDEVKYAEDRGNDIIFKVCEQ